MSAQVAVIKNAIHAAAMRPTKNPTTLSTFMG
jgi:hypothetical protein